MLDFLATLFSSARTMLPIVAGEILGVGVAGYGLLATAQPVGAVLAGTVLSLRRDIYKQGLALLGGILAALRLAEQTGEAQVVETSLFESAIWTQATD